jgi:hypothetical protein
VVSNRLNARIVTPCSKNWDEMKGTAEVRFCESCRKNVYNISSMTAHAAEALLAQTASPACLRIFHREDGTVLTADCPWGVRNASKKIGRLATAALSSALTFASVAAAQVQQTLSPESAQAAGVPTGALQGTVRDASGAPIAGVFVTCRSLASGQEFQIVSDSQGQFRTDSLPAGKFEVFAEAPGFERCKRELSVNPLLPARFDVTLQVGTIGAGVLIAKHRAWNPFSKLHLR